MTVLDDMLQKLPKSSGKPSRNKYGNRKCEVDGIKFDSKHEAGRYRQLKLMECAGTITRLEMQKSFVLVEPVILDGRRKPSIRYVADFVYIDERENLVVEDAKSPITRTDPVYRMKRHMMKSLHGIDVREV